VNHSGARGTRLNCRDGGTEKRGGCWLQRAVLGGFGFTLLFPHLKNPYNDKRKQGDYEKDKQNPSEALKRFNDRAVNFKNPSVASELNDLCILNGWLGDVLLQIPNAYAARNADDVQCEHEVTAPSRTNLVGDNPLEYLVDRFSERLGHDDGNDRS